MTQLVGYRDGTKVAIVHVDRGLCPITKTYISDFYDGEKLLGQSFFDPLSGSIPDDRLAADLRRLEQLGFHRIEDADTGILLSVPEPSIDALLL